MSPYELLDLALSLSNRIDTHWTLFITVHLALIGGIIYVDRPLQKNEKFAAMVIYTGFAVANYMMMRNQALFLASIYAQIFEFKDQTCCANNHVIDYIVNLQNRDSTAKMLTGLTVTHAAMYVVVTLSVLHDKAKPNSGKQDAEIVSDEN